MLEKLRNIGIIAHVDAGKTTLTERILYFGGSKHKSGDVDEGNTTTDYDPLEAEKGITIQNGAVSVFCAVGGVEVQSETVWHQANHHRVPRIAFVNKLDRTGADFFDCIKQMKEKLDIEPAICTLPAGQDANFQGVVDLVQMKFWAQDANDPA